MKKKYILLALFISLVSFSLKERPTIYIIGDSTVKNGKIFNGQKIVGWGELLQDSFDSTKISIDNEAIPGRSSRTYITENHWNNVLAKIKAGDYLLIQFGHNDPANIADTLKPRGSIKGIGEDSTQVYNNVFKRKEYVHSYGWYLNKIVTEAKHKGAYPIIITPIPRHIFTNGKVDRNNLDYGKWSKEIATKNNIPLIDLNEKVAKIYDSLGFEYTYKFFPKDHTHTNLEGARINANQIIHSIKTQPDLTPLRKYLY
ncbi:rhamnogalacturonan acetylesterase [Rhizosphaericola mali]|uniref:Rhamnogalacturonan acetylesterase n=1 Tax=Rhizosphaericola mali TaxID=2545455 RepID=A0A5P2G2S8_9BACT|nr:rhamnogalacturonan acetylesterase [Rhizosphaericola mali]QES88122.1 rhamnogalacturonan acetylesterase [Rhizosphaericola mali]